MFKREKSIVEKFTNADQLHYIPARLCPSSFLTPFISHSHYISQTVNLHNIDSFLNKSHTPHNTVDTIISSYCTYCNHIFHSTLQSPWTFCPLCHKINCPSSTLFPMPSVLWITWILWHHNDFFLLWICSRNFYNLALVIFLLMWNMPYLWKSSIYFSSFFV